MWELEDTLFDVSEMEEVTTDNFDNPQLSGVNSFSPYNHETASNNYSLQEQQEPMTSLVPASYSQMMSPASTYVPSPDGTSTQELSPTPLGTYESFFGNDDTKTTPGEHFYEPTGDIEGSLEIDELLSVDEIQHIQDLLANQNLQNNVTPGQILPQLPCANSVSTNMQLMPPTCYKNQQPTDEVCHVVPIKTEPCDGQWPRDGYEQTSTIQYTEWGQSHPVIGEQHQNSAPSKTKSSVTRRYRKGTLSNTEIQQEIERRAIKRQREDGLSIEEITRKEKRKLQNRVAAERCRQKKKVKSRETEKRELELVRQNEQQQLEIDQLRTQVAELQSSIAHHTCVKCVQQSSSSTCGLQPDGKVTE